MNRTIRSFLAVPVICVIASCQSPLPSARNDSLKTYRHPFEMDEPRENLSFPATTMSATPTPAQPPQGESPRVPLQRALPPEALAPSQDETTKSERSSDTIIENAQNAATQHPAAQAFINAVQFYHFDPGAVYEVVTAPGRITMLHLRPGEEIKHLAAGDTSRWLIDVVGAGNAESTNTGVWPNDAPAKTDRVSVLIKPRFPLLQTNLVIATNEREYLIDLRSFEKTYHSAVEWTYPQAPVVFSSQTRQRIALPARASNTRNFIYSLQAPPGGLPPWAPEAVYDDGHRVYVQFAPSINDFRRPPLYLLDDEGMARMVNYRTDGNRYVVDELFERAALRIGNERVVIQRTLPRPSAELTSGRNSRS